MSRKQKLPLFFQQGQFIFNYNVRNNRSPICVFCLQRCMHISDISSCALCHAVSRCVNRAGMTSRLTSILLCKISTCSSQKAGQRPVRFTEISASTTEILATGIKSFPYEHSSPGVFSQNSFRFRNMTTKMAQFLPCMYFHLCELPLLKPQGATRLR